jgi:hypothetical protein
MRRINSMASDSVSKVSGFLAMGGVFIRKALQMAA